MLHLGAALMAANMLAAQPALDSRGPEELLGTWRGTSTCTDRVAAPACQDEKVVYEFTAGKRVGTVHWIADKIVNGKRERMGELDLTYDTGEACWKTEFKSPRSTVIWRLSVQGKVLVGTAQLRPDNETVRRVELRRE